MNRMPDPTRSLSDELERAEILPGGRPDDVVCMGSDVAFRDQAIC
jgi:transcription elongation GreA/GreB family factor